MNRQNPWHVRCFLKNRQRYRLTAELSFRELGISKWGTRRNYLLDVAVVDRPVIGTGGQGIVGTAMTKPAFERNPSTWGSIHVTSELSAK